MSDPANVMYGRLKEAAWMSGQTFDRATYWLDTLLEGDAWQTVGPGFTDVNAFLRSIDLSPFNIADNHPGLVRRIKELQPDATERAISAAVGVSQATVHRDLNPSPAPDSDESADPLEDDSDLHEYVDPDSFESPDPEPDSGDELEPEPVTVPLPDDNPEPEPKQTTRELLAQSDQNDWRTPRKFLDAARAVLGAVDLDPASSAEANETVQAARFHTEDDDGLAQPWKGRIWLNPPYGGQARLFVERLVREYEVGNVTAAMTLVNSHPTETAWFQQLFRYTVCFVRGRIDFGGPSRAVASTSTHGSAIVYLGDDLEAFRREFSKFGSVVRAL